MKYWKGNNGTSKQNQYGSMNDNGFVPDSVECTHDEYNANIIVTEAVRSDIEKLIDYAKLQGWIS